MLLILLNKKIAYGFIINLWVPYTHFTSEYAHNPQNIKVILGFIFHILQNTECENEIYLNFRDKLIHNYQPSSQQIHTRIYSACIITNC